MRRMWTVAIAVSSALLALSHAAPIRAASPLVAERIAIRRGALPQPPNASCDFDRALVVQRRGGPSEPEPRVEDAVNAPAAARRGTHPIASNWGRSIRPPTPTAPAIEIP